MEGEEDGAGGGSQFLPIPDSNDCCGTIAEVDMYCRNFFGLLMLVVAICYQVPLAMAQESNSSDVRLTTKDGVRLKATYYPSTLGKAAVPIVLLHDFKESRTVFNGLARMLQTPAQSERPSHAVLTVDLRGHGESTTQEGRNGQTRELEAARLGKADFQNMVRFDMEAIRKFLVRKNDSGELNLNQLCLLGSGMGANVATNWAAVDWSAPPLASRKQGQDVKGLVLVSPDWGFRGIPLLKPLRQAGVREKISMMIIYGKQDRKSTKDAQTISKNLERYHPLPPPDERREKQDFFQIGLPTSLKGTRLVADHDFNMLPMIEQFLEARLSKQDYEWIKRHQ